MKQSPRMLGMTLDTWNDIRVATVFIAFVIGGAAFVANYIQLQLQRAESKTASDALEKYKSEAARDIALANQKAEQLRADNLVLEQSIRPRRWYGPFAASVRGGATATELFAIGDINSRLSTYAKTPVLIQFVPDLEARKLALQIARGLAAVGWEPQMMSPARSGIIDESIPDGVEVWTNPQMDSSWHAAQALEESLEAEGIQGDDAATKLHHDDPTSRLYPDGDIRKSIPVGTVVLLVGEKPGFYALMQKLGDGYRAAHPEEK
ncbi:hypothetical protein BRAO375_280009 [Bradyrhizobium sp. ORS 375]|uniref:hypothetical protein n=1 Tax=Bradyrhizobium sp. (strain ORS 375) TaxID=566679 RepID=UPI0002408047|nr:hypothetical protein [Bradyrhizobium sp. ORS 375]CCD93792.1 hypothetical protein BRAO375_280009 [Bradyrhizobium sp. ORS 375]